MEDSAPRSAGSSDQTQWETKHVVDSEEVMFSHGDALDSLEGSGMKTQRKEEQEKSCEVRPHRERVILGIPDGSAVHCRIMHRHGCPEIYEYGVEEVLECCACVVQQPVWLNGLVAFSDQSFPLRRVHATKMCSNVSVIDWEGRDECSTLAPCPKCLVGSMTKSHGDPEGSESE